MRDPSPARDQTLDSFVADLEKELREKRLSMLDCDFLRAVEAREVSRDQIREWAKVFYATTRHGRLTIGNFYANAPDDDELRRELAENIYEEETGRISGVGKCHMAVFQSLLDALGIGPDEASRLESPLGSGPRLGHPIAPEDYYIDLSAYGFSVEIPNAEFSARMARALRDNYGFSDDAVRWFTMHAELDADHGDEFRRHALKVADTPNGLERVRERTFQLSSVVKQSWDGFGSWR